MRVLNNIKFDKSTMNREDGTFKIRSTTTYPVLMQRTINGKTSSYYEVLSHNPEHINLDRISRGSVPFLLGHDQTFKIGTINSVEVVDGSHTISEVKVASLVKDKIFDYIEGDILGNGSIGARATKVVRTYSIDNIPAVEIAWEYYDLSLISTPADPDASITRSLTDDMQFTQDIQDESDIIERALTTFDISTNTLYNNDNIEAEKSTESLTAIDNEVKTEEDINRSIENITINISLVDNSVSLESTEDTNTEDNTEEDIKPNETHADIVRSVQINTNKDIKMSIFKIAKQVAEKSVTDDNKKFVIVTDTNTLITNEAIARSFTAGTGTNTAGYSDEGGNIIPRDMSSDYIKLIYDRFVLAVSGVPFINLKRATLFPVIETGGTAVWIDENGNATPSNMKTSLKAVKPHYLRIVSDISNSVIAEAHDNISIEQIYAQDWTAQIEQALQKAYIKGNPAVDAGSPTGIITILTGTPALTATNVLSFAGTAPSFVELNEAFAVVEDTQAPKSVVYANSNMKAQLLSTPVVAGQAVFLATDSGSGKANLLGRELYVVPSSNIADNELLIASPSSSFVASFHGGMEIISDDKILAGNNMHRFTIRAAYDVMFRYPKHFVLLQQV